MSALADRVRSYGSRIAVQAEGTVSSAVLMREAARTSRRWQTYAGRLAFSGMLLAGLLTAIWGAVEFGNTSSMGWLGRGLFIGIATMQFGMALLLAPLNCATAMAEETELGTLDLIVLTKLKSHQIVGGKVLSRVLVMLTLVFGALPVMAAVVTLGGVSGTEVIAVTFHTALVVVLAGGMGALFSLFTRSPLLAMMAAAGYAIPAFIVIPAAYAILSMDPRAATHLSLLGGPAAQGWDALLPLFVHGPVVWLTWRIGTKLFALRTSRANITKAFSGELWETKRLGTAFLVLMGVTFFLLPMVAMPLWALKATKSQFWPATVPLQGLIFVYGAAATWLVAWMYLRVGVDVVDAVDRTFTNRSGRARPPIRVWANPVAWREARPGAWGASAVPIQFTWLMGVLLLSQSSLWLIPGGLVGLALFNLIAATVLTVWLATWSIESERRIGSLEVLLTTTLPSWKVTAGKAAGIALPTLPLILISLPMLMLGNVYAKAFFDNGNGNPFTWLGHGLAAWVWSVAVWALALGLGILVALRAQKRSSFAISIAALAVCFGVPGLAGRLFSNVWWVAMPARLIAPPLAGDPTWWQEGLSTLAVVTVAVALFTITSLNLRRWVVTASALLAIGLTAASPALAAPEEQSKFLFEARAVNDGLVRENHWTAVHLSITNLGSAATAVIQLDERPPGLSEAIPFRRTVELPEQSRKDVLLMVQPGIGNRPRMVSLNAGPTRSAVAEVQWQAVDRDAVVIGVIGDDPMGLTALGEAWTGPVPGRVPFAAVENARMVRAGLVNPRLMPRHSAAYDPIDAMVWDRADPTAMGSRELDALLGWVASGGHLTLTVTDTWRQVADSALGDALPVDLVGTRDAQDLQPLLYAFGLSGGPDAPTPQALAVPRNDPNRGAWVLASDTSGYALWSIGSYGLGTITVLTADVHTEPLASHPRSAIWRSLLWLPDPGTPRSSWRYTLDSARPFGGDSEQPPSLAAALRVWSAEGADCFWGTGGNQVNNFDQTDPKAGWMVQVRERLQDIPGASPLPLSWLIGFSIVYLLAIGPLDYLILRRLKKEPWTWVTFPVTVVIFSGVALVGTAYTKGSQAVVTRVEVVDVLPGTDRWRGQTWLGVFATRKTHLTLASGTSDGVMALLEAGGDMWAPSVITEEGPGKIEYRAETWTTAFAESTWVEGGRGRLRIVEGRDGPMLENTLGVNLAEVVLIESDPTGMNEMARTLELGPLSVGDRAPIGAGERWSTRAPNEGELRWGWRVLREHPESIGAHLHGGSWKYTVLAVAERPVEQIALTGLAPIEQNLTVFRAPLGPPVIPGRPAWSDDLP